jgi:mannonate dehydratase
VKLLLYAFERAYDERGAPDLEHTIFHIPNEYARDVARRHPGYFEWVASIHPYRGDCVEELEKARRDGARAVKWLPSAMGIDPMSARCDRFYESLSRNDVPLIAHGGEERAVLGRGEHDFANPLRLRRALDAGVRVIVAHCASKGSAIDLDDPARGRAECFDLFLRLMDDPRYAGRAFGEISALTQSGRTGRPLLTMLARTDLHERLVNGSDYPLPAIDVLYRTGELEDLGYLTEEEADQLDEVWDVNPLLFDLVLKRTVKHPRTGARFPASVFRARPEIAPE